MKTEFNSNTEEEGKENMSKKVAAKKMGAKPNPRDAKVRALRDSDPKKWTWAKLDEKVYGAKGSHGGRSFVAYKREAARLKAVKRSHHAKVTVSSDVPKVRGQSRSAAKVAASRVNAKK